MQLCCAQIICILFPFIRLSGIVVVVALTAARVWLAANLADSRASRSGSVAAIVLPERASRLLLSQVVNGLRPLSALKSFCFTRPDGSRDDARTQLVLLARQNHVSLESIVSSEIGSPSSALPPIFTPPLFGQSQQLKYGGRRRRRINQAHETATSALRNCEFPLRIWLKLNWPSLNQASRAPSGHSARLLLLSVVSMELHKVERNENRDGHLEPLRFKSILLAYLCLCRAPEFVVVGGRNNLH